MKLVLLLLVLMVLLTGCLSTQPLTREQTITPIVRIDYNDSLVRQEVKEWIRFVDDIKENRNE